jgi:hypothetical protein
MCLPFTEVILVLSFMHGLCTFGDDNRTIHMKSRNVNSFNACNL